MKFKLKSCVWEITLACCFSCKYCGSKGGHAREEELTTEECLQVASQLADLGCRRVSLIGGEVFMRPDWDVIAQSLTKRGVKVAIITNGYLFSEDSIRRLKAVPIESVAVSVDGPAAIHDKYRQPGSFERAERAVRVLTQNGIPVSIISTINGENVAYLEAFYQQIKEWPVFAWQLQACSPMGNAADNGVNFVFRHKRVIDFVEKHLEEAPFSIGIGDNIGYFTDMEGFLRGNLSGKAIFSGCRAGLTSIGIDSVGNVRGCESMYDERFNEGNLREKTLREIWESPDAFAYNRKFSRDMLTGTCGECQYGKYCAGGCRSYNFFVHGKLYESPACARMF
ncbi:MAG: radical SAM protein [bacterium]|nr:radical SAM protein [bacterium]